MPSPLPATQESTPPPAPPGLGALLRDRRLRALIQLAVVGLVLVLTSFYHVMLPRRLPWRRHLPGALLAMGFSLVASVVLRTYVADILVTALPYGALAAPIAVLLFCFFFAMAVLLGAELNATIQARWPAPLRRHDRRRRERRAAKLEREARRLGLL